MSLGQSLGQAGKRFFCKLTLLSLCGFSPSVLSPFFPDFIYDLQLFGSALCCEAIWVTVFQCLTARAAAWSRSGASSSGSLESLNSWRASPTFVPSSRTTSGIFSSMLWQAPMMPRAMVAQFTMPEIEQFIFYRMTINYRFEWATNCQLREM